ncbi:MAG: nucleotide exchange factor GrpE [Rhodothermales bacterium]|nr:nucleotide exchange factor GrpE [Rhodothermales bacterium]
MSKEPQDGHARDAATATEAAQPEAAPHQTPPPATAPHDAAQQLETLAHELERTKEQLLRQAAEFQNYRRRTEKERAALLDRGRAQVIEPLLDVLDDFRRSLEAAAEAETEEQGGPAYRALRQGVELVYQKYSDELMKLGVERIEAVGQPFDEHLHEAMMQQPAPEGTAPGTVLAEIQRGYRLGDRVLRHARVVVAA